MKEDSTQQQKFTIFSLYGQNKNLHLLVSQSPVQITFQLYYYILFLSMKTIKQNLHSQNPPNRMAIYIVTLLSFSATVGIIGTYSVIKDGMSDEFGLEEGFLGICDSLSSLGNLVGLIYLMYCPSVNIKRDYLLNCLNISVMFIVITIMPLFPHYVQPALIFVNVLSGFSRAYFVLPSIMILQYFDAQKDKKLINIWYTLSGLGDVFSVLFLGSLMEKAKVNWKYCLIIGSLSMLLLAILQDFFIDQIKTDSLDRSNDQFVEGEHKSKEEIIAQFFGQCGNIMWTVDYVLIKSLYYVVLLWFPYYFLQVGYKQQSIIISVMFPIFFCLGNIIYENIIQHYALYQDKVVAILLGINMLAYCIMSFFGSSQRHMLYIVFSAVSGFVAGGPYSVISLSELVKRSKKNNNFYYPYTVVNILEKVLTVILMAIIGYFMQRQLKSFLYILCLTTATNFFVYFLRKILDCANQLGQCQSALNESKNI